MATLERARSSCLPALHIVGGDAFTKSLINKASHLSAYQDSIHVICDVEVISGQSQLVLQPSYAFFQKMAEAPVARNLIDCKSG
jgi:hypothetical protein